MARVNDFAQRRMDFITAAKVKGQSRNESLRLISERNLITNFI